MRAVAAAAVAATALACATAVLTDQQLEQHLREVAVAVPEMPRGYGVMALNAQSEMDAWSQWAQSAGEGPSQRAHLLARAFARGAHSRVGLAVGGPYGQLNERVLLDAFSLVHEPRLPGLTLLLVSPKPPSDELRHSAASLGATLLHRPYEPGP